MESHLQFFLRDKQHQLERTLPSIWLGKIYYKDQKQVRETFNIKILCKKIKAVFSKQLQNEKWWIGLIRARYETPVGAAEQVRYHQLCCQRRLTTRPVEPTSRILKQQSIITSNKIYKENQSKRHLDVFLKMPIFLLKLTLFFY